MQQGKPSGLAKNARGGICPAGRDCTFEGVPMYGGGGRRYCFFLTYASPRALFLKIRAILHFYLHISEINCNFAAAKVLIQL